MTAKKAPTLRIIGGQWRSRRLPIAAVQGLRPTADRVRETVFNWLAPRLTGARCLDLYAGTGALGLEALSRGARHVCFIEQNAQAVRNIQQNLDVLQPDPAQQQAQVIQGDALAANLTQQFDCIFIDPPFNHAQYAPILAAAKTLLAPQGRIYLEYNKAQEAAIDQLLAEHWHSLKHKQAGQVGFRLLTAL